MPAGREVVWAAGNVWGPAVQGDTKGGKAAIQLDATSTITRLVL